MNQLNYIVPDTAPDTSFRLFADTLTRGLKKGGVFVKKQALALTLGGMAVAGTLSGPGVAGMVGFGLSVSLYLQDGFAAKSKKTRRNSLAVSLLAGVLMLAPFAHHAVQASAFNAQMLEEAARNGVYALHNGPLEVEERIGKDYLVSWGDPETHRLKASRVCQDSNSLAGVIAVMGDRGTRFYAIAPRPGRPTLGKEIQSSEINSVCRP